jgi:hypothetical protein
MSKEKKKEQDSSFLSKESTKSQLSSFLSKESTKSQSSSFLSKESTKSQSSSFLSKESKKSSSIGDEIYEKYNIDQKIIDEINDDKDKFNLLLELIYKYKKKELKELTQSPFVIKRDIKS